MGAPFVLPNLPIELQLPRGAEPWTVQRLRSLRSGESTRFYTGSLADLDNAELPRTAALLRRIFAVADELERRGEISVTRVKISTKAQDDTGRPAQFAFTAIGQTAAPPPMPPAGGSRG